MFRFLTIITTIFLLGLTACGGGSSAPTANNPAAPTTTSPPPTTITASASFVSEHFIGSANCSSCHNGIRDENGNDVSIVTDWSSTMMANATRDPFWKAKVRSEINRNPELEELINDKCTRCHAPMANEEMKRNNETIQLFADGMLSASNNRHDEAMDGVSCTLCHQIPDTPSLGTPNAFSGHFEINETKTIYGPYTNLVAQPMISFTGYTPVYSEHIKDSDLCANCHELKTPFVNEFGTIMSQSFEEEFPEQTPYSEWLNSDYADQQSCQDCHMSRTDGVIMSNRPGSLSTRRDNFAIHDFIGANKMMLDIFDKNREQLAVPSNNFAETISKTETMLASAANIEQLQSSLSGGVLTFDLKINSETGHKLPSAYPSRRVILHVSVIDSSGAVVFESGRPNDNGSIDGLDSDNDRSSYEPHYNLITNSDQVQVYEAIMANTNDEVTYTLLRSAKYLKDNRILPTGFDKVTAPNDVAVKGLALIDGDFIGGSDQITYQISNLSNSSYTIEAELVYQTIAYSFAQDLFLESDTEVTDFKSMYDASEFKAIPITSLQFNVQ